MGRGGRLPRSSCVLHALSQYLKIAASVLASFNASRVGVWKVETQDWDKKRRFIYFIFALFEALLPKSNIWFKCKWRRLTVKTEALCFHGFFVNWDASVVFSPFLASKSARQPACVCVTSVADNCCYNFTLISRWSHIWMAQHVQNRCTITIKTKCKTNSPFRCRMLVTC